MSETGRSVELAGRAVIVAVAIVAIAVIGTAAERQRQSVGRRFAGFALYGSMAVDRMNQPYWSGIRAGLRPGDRVVAVEGTAVRSVADVARAAAAEPEGSAIRYTIERGGRLREIDVPTMTFRWIDFIESYALYALTALVFVLGGASIAWYRLDACGTGLFCCSTAIALAIGGGIQLALHDPLASEGRLSIPLVAAAIFHLALVFPESLPFVRRRPAWVLAPYLAMLPLAAPRILFALRGEAAPAIFARVDVFVPLAAGLAVLAAFVRVRRRWRTGIAARRIRLMQTGVTIAVAIHGVGFLATELGVMPPAPNLTFLLPAWVWIVTMTIGAIRLDLFELGAARRGELARGAVFVVTVALYLASFGSAAFAFGSSGGDPRVWVVAAALLLVAIVAYEPLRWLARRIVEIPAAGGRGPRSSALREISERLAAALEPGDVEAAVAAVPARFGLTRARLILGDGRSWPRGATGGLSAEQASTAQMLLRASATGGSAHGRDGHDPAGGERAPGDARDALEQLGLAAVLPLRAQGRLLGGLGLGPPLHGGLIGSSDLAVLGAIADQVALSLETVDTLERIRELERALSAENVVLKEELLAKPGPGGLVGASAPMRQLLAWIEHAGPTDATVLLRGETGTGKELVARALHAASARRDRPMVRINCAAVPEGLLEAEFFGYERGAFTGAVARKLGRFELADGGTLFLDEIGDLPENLQPKLLRVLQERQFERVGGSAPISIDVRVIAATNRDLEALVRQGRFREDLFFRLNVLPCTLAPLRDRREDVPALVAHFLRRHEARSGRAFRGIDERSLRELSSYHWPGNVRELENVIERAVILARGETLVVPDLPGSAHGEPRARRLRPLAEEIREAKVRAIRAALARCGGNQARAAALLGLRPSSLSRMMKQLELRPSQARRRRSAEGASGAADTA